MLIYILGDFLDLVTQGVRNLRRAYLSAVTVVLRLIVEELVVRQDLDDRKSHILLSVIIYGASQLPAGNCSLSYEHVALCKSAVHSLLEILCSLHLRHAEAASAICRLHKHRQTEFLHCKLCKAVHRLSLAKVA